VEGWLGPDEIWSVLEESPSEYAIVESGRVESSPLHDVAGPGTDPRRLDPFLVVERDDSGAPRLESRVPPAAIAELFEEGAVAFSEGDWGEALTRFEACTERAPEYFKSHTYLGRAWLFLDEPERARAAFRRALELNPLDYQAHMFLADAWVEERRWREAKAALTRAWTLNPNSEAIEGRLRHVLHQLDLRIRRERLDPDVAIRKEDATVRIELGGSRAARWLPLAACLACWRYEPTCAERAPGNDDPLRLAMFRECLLNQVATVAARRERGDRVGTDELGLLEAVHAGYLEAVVLWEVVARRTPVMMLLVPDPLRGEVENYVNRFVFVSTLRL